MPKIILLSAADLRAKIEARRAEGESFHAAELRVCAELGVARSTLRKYLSEGVFAEVSEAALKLREFI